MIQNAGVLCGIKGRICVIIKDRGIFDKGIKNDGRKRRIEGRLRIRGNS